MAAIALIVATVPRDDWKERSNDTSSQTSNGASTPSGSSAGDTVPLRYDPAELAVYFSRRPVTVVQRNALVAKHFCAFVGSILLDAKTGNWEKAMPGRAKWLRLIAEELGPTYVKVGSPGPSLQCVLLACWLSYAMFWLSYAMFCVKVCTP